MKEVIEVNRIRYIFIVLFIAALIPACGLIYTDIKTPMAKLSVQMTADEQSKIGKASCTSYVWIIGIGDCSVTEAMKNGEIKKVHHIDTEIKSIFFGIYERYTTVIYGE